MSFGYRHDILDAHQAFWAPGAKTVKPLRNEIHPLWKQDRFRMGGHKECIARSKIGLHWDAPDTRMPDELYKTIEPALRLASTLMAHSRYFYMKILRAKDVQVKGVNVMVRKGVLNGRKMLQCLDPAWTPTQEDEEAYDAAIKEITGPFRLYCGEGFKTMIPNLTAHAATCNRHLPSYWVYNYFCREYFDEFASAGFRHKSILQRQRLLFHFTTVLLHELAHVFNHKRREAEMIRIAVTRGSFEPEPLFEPEDNTVELGLAWETWAFGGRVDTTGKPVDFKTFGFIWSPGIREPNPADRACLDFPYLEFIIHASTLPNFFSTAGWEKHRNGSQPLQLTLTPLRALYGNVEDKKDDTYAANFRYRLERMHVGRTSAAVRNYWPTSPPLSPLPMDVDVEKIASQTAERAHGWMRK
jgi:hypothetical protein